MAGELPPDRQGRPGADVVVLPYMGDPARWHRLSQVPGLRLVQLLTAGYDGVPEVLPPGVGLATGKGIHDASTAELAVGLTLASLRGIGEAVLDGQEHRWEHLTRPSLADRRVLIVGAGAVAVAIGDRLAPFETQVTYVASRARQEPFGEVRAVSDLLALLAQHEVVILACPLTEATRGLIGAAELAAMPDGAVLVNVARGPVVVTEALVKAAKTGRITAALDVVDPEPLPSGHALWGLRNVIVTPHVGGDSSAFPPRARLLLKDQLSALAAGLPVRNLVVPLPEGLEGRSA